MTLGAEATPLDSVSTPKSEVSPSKAQQDIPAPIIEIEYEQDDGTVQWRRKPERGYWNAMFWSMLFPASIHNLATFLTLWGVFAFLDCLPMPRFRLFYILGFFWLAIWCWYIAFRVAVIESAAGGHFRLPDVEIATDFWADLLEPAMRWCGSWLVVLIPAFIYSTIQGYRGINVISNSWQAIMNPALLGVAGPTVDATLLSLLSIGLFFWPMVILVATIGGFGHLWRVDQLLYTLGNSFMPYLVTVAVVFATYAIYVACEAFLTTSVGAIYASATFQALGLGLLKRVLATGIELYTAIVAARAIGLYFRHFGHRFAWDWGQMDE